MKRFYTAVLVVITLLAMIGSVVSADGPVGADCTDPPNLVPFADLVNCDLSGRDMEGVDLSNANLTGANLDDADLFTSILRGATFDNASLRNAIMEDADAREASLMNADMRRVEFYANGVRINLDGTAPYSYDWSPPVDGTYVITARATDNDGDTATSQSVTVDVVASPNNQPPTVSTTSPKDNAKVSRRWGTMIRADADDPDGDFVRVEFYADGTFLGADLFPPFSNYWRPDSSGSRTLTAKAIDETGLEATSDPVTVRVR